jgi:hypothetical protein
MNYKTSELAGPQLDQAVAKACGYMYDKAIDKEVVNALDGSRPMAFFSFCSAVIDGRIRKFSPSSDWADGGPIIEKEGISVMRDADDVQKSWCACFRFWFQGGLDTPWAEGPTQLIAAMRCFVARKFGEEVEL